MSIFQLKKIDSLLLKSFVPPFIMAFFIALFVLVMQFLWKFIDDIVGKGIDIFDLSELLFYRSLSLFPLALPIGVLLAAVMVLGNMSEKYELSSLKSAGVSLLRIMLALIVFAILVAIFSFYCSNSLIPTANLKFQSRLYDIRKQKSALVIEEGIFNEDFKGFSIRVGEKASDNRHIKDVLIYDDSPRNKGKIQLVTAESGEMFISENDQFFVMKLYNGHQYQEMTSSSGTDGLPFVRTNFKEWEKQFDLSEFDMQSTDPEAFKSHHMMKSVRQLMREIDTLDLRMHEAINRNTYSFANIIELRKISNRDTVDVETENPTESDVDQDMIEQRAIVKKAELSVNTSATTRQNPTTQRLRKNQTLTDVLDTLSNLQSYDWFVQVFESAKIRRFSQRAIQNAKNIKANNGRNLRVYQNIHLNKLKHIYELHSKYSLAVVCIIFLFIGGPMGAIVRKGGYGYPLLIAIFFFTMFIILNIMCKKFMETESLPPVFSAWLPCLILSPIGVILTLKAMNDSKLLNADRFLKPIIKFFSKDSDKNESPN